MVEFWSQIAVFNFGIASWMLGIWIGFPGLSQYGVAWMIFIFYFSYVVLVVFVFFLSWRDDCVVIAGCWVLWVGITWVTQLRWLILCVIVAQSCSLGYGQYAFRYSLWKILSLRFLIVVFFFFWNSWIFCFCLGLWHLNLNVWFRLAGLIWCELVWLVFHSWWESCSLW